MSFWNDKNIEPKRKFRWLLYLSGMPQFIVKQVKKPEYKVANQAHQFLNYEFYFPGKVTWSPITFTIVDPVQPDSTQSLYNILSASGYVIPSDYTKAGLANKTIAKSDMVDALGGQIQIVQLDPAGRAIETWTLNNPLIESASFDTLDYNSDDLLNIQVSIKYDWATLDTPGGDGRVWATNTTPGGPAAAAPGSAEAPGE